MIRPADSGDLPALRAVWDMCFPGDAVFGDFFFSELYTPERALAFQHGSSVTSMLHMLPFRLGGGGEAAYIYGVGTLPEYRRHGHAAALIAEALRLNEICFLIPQEDWLFGFYEKLGFKTAFYRREFSAEIPGNARHAGGGDIPRLNAIYQNAVDVRVERTARHWGHILNGGAAFIWDGGYAIIEKGASRPAEAFGLHTAARITEKPFGMANKWPSGGDYLNFMYN